MESNRFRPIIGGTAHLFSGIQEPFSYIDSNMETPDTINDLIRPFPSYSMESGVVFKDFRSDLFALQFQYHLNFDQSFTALATAAIAVHDNRTHVGLQKGLRLYLNRPGSIDSRLTFIPYDVFATRDAGKFGLFGLGIKNIQVFKKESKGAIVMSMHSPERSFSRTASHLDYGYGFGQWLLSLQLLMGWGPRDVPGGALSISYTLK